MGMVARAVCCIALAGLPLGGASPDGDAVRIEWKAEAGVPLRVYLTRRLPKRLNEPVHATLLESVYSFNHEIIPAGAEVTGRVVRLAPVSKGQRFAAVMEGDFTPLHEAEVEFTEVKLADGRTVPLRTTATAGLNSIYDPGKAKRAKAAQPAGGTLQQAKAQIVSRVSARADSVAGMVRGPDKMERFGDFFLMKLPYHPQWVRKGTRFDAPIREAVDFGSGTLAREDLASLGTQPDSDSVAHVRFVAAASSGTSKRGDAVSAVLSEPLFSAGNKLVLPEGTRLSGTVTQVRPARWFHRGGQLRFAFDRVDLPEGAPRIETQRPAATQVRAVLEGAESGGQARVEVDPEGNARVVEPKTRFILPVIAAMIAARGGDHDDKQTTDNTDSNHTGRHVLGGGLGFGLLGMVAAHSSSLTGTALGYYGLAWSVYRNIFSRGEEVEFGKDAAMDIRFGSRPKPAAGQ